MARSLSLSRNVDPFFIEVPGIQIMYHSIMKIAEDCRQLFGVQFHVLVYSSSIRTILVCSVLILVRTRKKVLTFPDHLATILIVIALHCAPAHPFINIMTLVYKN